MLKAMTLNLWCYFDWEKRKDTIVSVVRNFNPDFVAFQEVQTNHSFSPWPQSDFIADSCDFTYRVFAPTYKRDGQIDKDGNMNQETSYGLAFISKHPIISVETYFLRQHPDHDEACSVVFVTLDINGERTEICNVHFGNSDLFSDLHLNELMDLCEKRNIKPILLGDFNHFNLATYKKTRLKDYTLSTEVAQYESMPKNQGTLDYIVVPSAKYSIKSVVCPEEYVSDHRALCAIIEQK